MLLPVLVVVLLALVILLTPGYDELHGITLRTGHFPERTIPERPDLVYFGIEIKNGIWNHTELILSFWIEDKDGRRMGSPIESRITPYFLSPGDSHVECVVVRIVGMTHAPRFVRPYVHLADGQTIRGKIHHIPIRAWLMQKNRKN